MVPELSVVAAFEVAVVVAVAVAVAVSAVLGVVVAAALVYVVVAAVPSSFFSAGCSVTLDEGSLYTAVEEIVL